MAPTVSGVVADASGQTAAWSADWTTDGAPTSALPMIGMSAPKGLWSQRVGELGSAASLLQARRIFCDGGPTDPDLQTLTKQADDAGLVPHISFKVGSWASVANGSLDTALRNAKTYLDGRRRRAYITFHHEPDQQSDPRDVGEGGTAAEFAAMYRRLIPLMRSEFIRVGPCWNGWWWSAQARGFTDTDIDKWFPADLIAAADFIAADHYTASATESETAVMRVARMVSWARRKGVRVLSVWETNAFTPKDLTDVFALAAAEPLFRDGACLVWNSAAGTYKPLVETGLLDDFQAILRDWPR